MVGSCEKMSISIFPSTTNNYKILDGQKIFMASSTAAANQVMERSNQDPLKCPRCDSSNTKFCYYNNYSLSQPRHFCKACKRYWTRGGTLRSVPVGGGCRKNKKVKRQPSNGGDGISSSSAAAVATSTATIKSSTAQPEMDPFPTSNRINNPLLFSLPTNHLELNFPFSRFNTTRVSSDSTGFIHQVQINDTNPMFFGSSTSFSTAPTSAMASLLASSIQQQRFSTADVQTCNDFSGLMPYEDMQMLVGNGGIEKESNIVEGENRLEWNSNQIEQINSSDSSSLLWNTNNVGALLDPSNMGSSVLL